MNNSIIKSIALGTMLASSNVWASQSSLKEHVFDAAAHNFLQDSISLGSAFNSSNTIYLSKSQKLPSSHENAWRAAKTNLIYSLQNLKHLEHGWDGYEALPINEAAIDDAQFFATTFPRYLEHPTCVPLSGGSVSLYWKTADSYVELGFDGDGTYYAYSQQGGHKYRNDSISLNGAMELPEELLNVLLTLQA